MTVKAYCDGSGKSVANSESRFLTLAACFGTENSWPDFEREWVEILREHNAPEYKGAPYFHASEAAGGWGRYAGWEYDRVRRLIIDLFKVLASLDRSDLFSVSRTINLDDYRKVKTVIPTLRSPEAMCIDFCLGTIFRHPQRETDFELFFDRNEPFRRIVEHLWKMRRPKRVCWGSHVISVTSVEMKATPAVQAADLLAWFSNRYWATGAEDRWGRFFAFTFLAKEHFHSAIDEAAMLTIFDAHGKLRRGVQLTAPSIKLPKGTKLLRQDD